jgi:hypothetical protein
MPNDRGQLDEALHRQATANITLAMALPQFYSSQKLRGYLRLQCQKEVLKEVDQLLDTNLDDILQESQYLLELDFTSLYNSSFERQSYWVLAMKAA